MAVAAPGRVETTRGRTPRNKWLRALTVAGFAVPVVFYLWFVQHYSLNVLYFDQWSDASLIRASYDGHLSWATLWAQHNENRMLFPNLLVLGMSRLDAYNVVVETYLSAVLLLASVALVISTHRRRATDRPWLAYCPVVILMLSVVQAQNMLWGFQLAWFIILAALAGVLNLLDRPRLSGLALIGAVVLGVIGSFSSIQGLFIWIAGLVLLGYRRRSPTVVALWLGAGAVTTAIYYAGYDANATVYPSLTAIHLPGQAVRFYFESIGDVLGIPLSSSGTGADLVMALGCVIVVLAVVGIVAFGRHRDDEHAFPVGIALTVYGLLFALSTTWGRTWAGASAASASRYTTYDLLVLVGCYLTYIGRRRSDAAQTTKVVHRTFRALLTAVIVLVAVFGLVNGVRWARQYHGGLPAVASIAVDADHLPGPILHQDLDPALSGAELRADARVLAAHGLTLFSDPEAVAGYRQLAAQETRHGSFAYTPPPVLEPSEVLRPVNDSKLSGRTLLVAYAAPKLRPRRVQFVVSGTGIKQLVLTARRSLFLWAYSWHTGSVPNGTYQVKSVVTGSRGLLTQSKTIEVTVEN